MPIYDYECKACGQTYETLQKVGETSKECKLCGSDKVHKLLTSGSFRIHGGGVYNETSRLDG